MAIAAWALELDSGAIGGRRTTLGATGRGLVGAGWRRVRRGGRTSHCPPADAMIEWVLPGRVHAHPGSTCLTNR